MNKETDSTTIQTIEEAIEKEDIEFEALPLDMKFELLLHRKVLGKTNTQKTSMRKYYRDAYKKAGVIPNGMYHQEGRKVSGRKGGLPEKVEKAFIEMVKESASKITAPGFITKRLRTIVNFHRRLEDKFGEIPIQSLYSMVYKHELKKYIEKPDYDDARQNKILSAFQNVPIFNMIQIDGCRFHYIQIKNENNLWQNPQVIEFLDTCSRHMFEMEIYFSESNENSVDAFSKFLRATEFPQKTVGIRPDKAKGFLNLKRPIQELNNKYSFPDKFFFAEDFARALKAKDKPHLESSHRRLHGFEDFIIFMLHEKLSERIPNVKIKNSGGETEIITVSRFDITIEELRAMGLHKRYIKDHNERMHTFSVAGRQEMWRPIEKIVPYLNSVDTFKFQEADIEDCLKYGFKKEKATVAPNGKIRFRKHDYQIIGNFYGGSKRIDVKVSVYKNKLYIFKPDERGVCIGEAIRIDEYKAPEHIKEWKAKKLKKNEFEQILAYLERQGMTIKQVQLERLLELHKQGLNAKIVLETIETHKETYENYLKKFEKTKVGLILSSLFLTHVENYLKKTGIL